MSTPEKFAQRPDVGATVVVSTGLGFRPYLTRITGAGVKGDEPIFFHEGNGWARPEDLTVIPPRMAQLMEDVYARVRTSYPEILTDEAKGEVYLAVLPAYVATGSDRDDRRTLLTAVQGEVSRLQGPTAPGI